MNTVVLRRACRAEWTKLHTDTGFWWLLAGLVSVTVAMGAATSGSARSLGDPARLALSGVTVGQALAVLLAVLNVGGEYGTGLINTTLSAVPARLTMLAAKAAVLSLSVAVAGGVAVAGSLLVGHLLLPGAPAVTDAPMLRAAVGSVVYLVLIELLSLGVTFALRDGAAASAASLALLYLFPLLSHVVTDPWLQRQLARIGPMPAGLTIQATRDLSSLPTSPWAGLGVLGLWTAAALLAGAAVLRWRRR